MEAELYSSVEGWITHNAPHPLVASELCILGDLGKRQTVFYTVILRTLYSYFTQCDSRSGVAPHGREMVAGDGGCQARSRLALPRLDDADDAAAADDLPRESRHGKDEGHLDPGVDFHDVIGEEEDT